MDTKPVDGNQTMQQENNKNTVTQDDSDIQFIDIGMDEYIRNKRSGSAEPQLGKRNSRSKNKESKRRQTTLEDIVEASESQFISDNN